MIISADFILNLGWVGVFRTPAGWDVSLVLRVWDFFTAVVGGSPEVAVFRCLVAEWCREGCRGVRSLAAPKVLVATSYLCCFSRLLGFWGSRLPR